VNGASVLVVAKAPEPGRVKTRLGRVLGMDAAAEVAAASLLDTLEACAGTGADCHLSLAGDLDAAVRGDEVGAALDGWTVHPQVGEDLAARIADAHSRVSGPVVQVGMDTPQLTGALLWQAATELTTSDAVLGPAVDGGWWVLALRDPAAAVALVDVPMSTPSTAADTRSALEAAGLTVGSAWTLRDVDTVADGDAVAALAPRSRFAATWASVREGSPG
jgi:rSAM/selenodomain-associated transferase 1